MIQNSTTCRFCEFPIGECWDVNQFMFYLCLFYLHCNVSDWWRMPVQRASAPYQTPCCAAESTLVVHRGCPLPPRHNPPPIPLLLWPSGGHTASGSLPGLPFLPLSTATSPPLSSQSSINSSPLCSIWCIACFHLRAFPISRFLSLRAGPSKKTP